VKVRISLSIGKDVLRRIDDIVSDEESPFYGNRSQLIEYYLRKYLPPKGDISVEMETKSPRRGLS